MNRKNFLKTAALGALAFCGFKQKDQPINPSLVMITAGTVVGIPATEHQALQSYDPDWYHITVSGKPVMGMRKSWVMTCLEDPSFFQDSLIQFIQKNYFLNERQRVEIQVRRTTSSFEYEVYSHVEIAAQFITWDLMVRVALRQAVKEAFANENYRLA